MPRCTQGSEPGLDHTPLEAGAKRRRKPKEFGLTPAESIYKHRVTRSPRQAKIDALVKARRLKNVGVPQGRPAPGIGRQITYTNPTTGRRTHAVVLGLRQRNCTQRWPWGGFWVVVSARHGAEKAIALEDIIE